MCSRKLVSPDLFHEAAVEVPSRGHKDVVIAWYLVAMDAAIGAKLEDALTSTEILNVEKQMLVLQFEHFTGDAVPSAQGMRQQPP